LAADGGQLIIQDNSGFGSTNLAFVAQSYVPNRWYRLEVAWGIGGSITARLFDNTGTTLLKSVQATDNNITEGGIGFLATTYDKYFDTVTVKNGTPPPGGGAANGPFLHGPQGATENPLGFFLGSSVP